MQRLKIHLLDGFQIAIFRIEKMVMISKSTKACTVILLIFLSLHRIHSAYAQGSSGSEAEIEPRYLVDLPTAGMLSHGRLAFDLDFYQGGGVLFELSIGAFDRLMLSASYGGRRIIGSDTPQWNNIPGFQIKVRLIDETLLLPAIALGFNSQGREYYLEELSRYRIKSMGFYLVVSKNYRAMGFLSLHGGINYSLERADGDQDPNFFAGAEKTLGPFLSLLVEYNLALNDNSGEALGRGRGYLNIGIRASLGSGLTIGMNLKDLFENQPETETAGRTIKIEYVKTL